MSAPLLLARTFFDNLVKRVPYLGKAVAFKDKWTYQLEGATPEVLAGSISKRFNLKASGQEKLQELLKTKEGRDFILERADAINRESYHRTAFAFNAAAQFGLVDITGLLLPIPYWYAKLGLAGLNAGLSLYAHHRMHREVKSLLKGPQKLPPKRWFFGLLRNRQYNRAVQNASKAYKKAAWRENVIYRPAYFLNGAAQIYGGQSSVMFPIGTAFNWLVTYPIAAGNIWRGMTSGTAALKSTQIQNTTLGKLQI